MAEQRIRSEKELAERIAQLQAKKSALEANITAAANDLYANIRQPSKLIRDCVRDLAGDSDFRFDVLKLATGFFAKFFSAKRKASGAAGKAFNMLNLVVDFFAKRASQKS